MKTTTIITLLLATLAAAAPAPAAADESTLERRGCPAGYSCMSGECYQYTCASSGWCSWSPSGQAC
ncbi:uncharacterized protein C8A04DRAFT_30735 [Dichotomopilus funicola]|uniref:Uncharacterized protein n=1 Tax=Dichotomopilus funicola TaxID=1934379 RepID=A0AAN6ZL50_9PEZI|nr:hypothetical protein C8A04DRAFT_30735 [Dichotomopilus funicola]